MLLIYAIGLLAQLFFSARVAIQWIMSERQRRVVTPTIYWFFSLVGAVLMIVYGLFRNDFSILLGQTLSYYIYMWNLHAQGYWAQLRPRFLRWLLVVLPVVVGAILVRDTDNLLQLLFHNEDIPLWLLLMGSLGQSIFSMRFVYQWYYSFRKGESVLPVGFWIISVAGSALIIIYGIIRLDPVLILGQSFGNVPYVRNIMLALRERREKAKEQCQSGFDNYQHTP
ncbi:MAG: lipid-A-disaccharide synthase N-terminal domain-containing protein [Bacteroidaceae bacterium]|nr:lipid-A-disaccharide synthase N-terminal domain-containing protein [Bacteroidaceae bacterium]